MARLPYSNFHDLNLDFVLKVIKKAFTPDNPPPYPVKSVNGLTGNVTVSGDIIPLAPNNSEKVTDAIRGKQTAPAALGNPGQVLGLDANQTPVWTDQTGGVTSYDELTGKPAINGVPLSGEMEGSDLGLIDAPSVPGTAGQVLTSDGQGGQSWQTPSTPPAPGAGDYAPIIMDSVSGPVASFPDGADNLEIASLVAEIVPVQAGTGDPSPSNVRSISGRGGITVIRAGVNLADIPNIDAPKTTNTWKYLDVELPLGNYVLSFDLANVQKNNNQVTSVIRIVYADGTDYYFDTNQIKRISDNQTMQNGTYPLTGRYYLTVSNKSIKNIGFLWRSDVYLQLTSGSISNIMIESGTSASGFVAYAGTEILEAWGDVAGTVYGGTLDIVSGVLTVDCVITDMGNLSWSYNSNSLVFSAIPTPSAVNKIAGDYTGKCYCEKLKTISSANLQNNEIGIGWAGYFVNRIIAKCSDYTDTQSFKTAFTGTKVVYEITTPTNYQLTPQQVQTILGRNNIYSDSGNCSVTYRADTKLFILKVIA